MSLDLRKVPKMLSVWQINGPLLSLSLIRTLDRVIICYMKVVGTIEHEQITERLIQRS